MDFLAEMGARPDQVAALEDGFEAGRVVAQLGPVLVVATAKGQVPTRLSGALKNAATSGEDLAFVGDYVGITRGGADGDGRIDVVLPRTTLLRRRAAGSENEAQIIAANVDVVFAVAALERGFSPRRIERAIVIAREAAATPVVVLTKADLCEDVEGAKAAASAVAGGAEVIVVSIKSEGGWDALALALPPKRTGVLLGTSGAGKSTLTNRLLGADRMAVGAVRAADDRGRHTTSHREILRAPWGAFLLDGPGVRELGMTSDEGLEETFGDVVAIAATCRFTDCGHDNEPGCAVRAAVESGALPGGRLEAFRKLATEAALRRAEADDHERRSRKSRDKSTGKPASHASKKKR